MSQAADVQLAPGLLRECRARLFSADTHPVSLRLASIDSPQQKAAGSDTTHGLGVHAVILDSWREKKQAVGPDGRHGLLITVGTASRL